MGSSDSRFPGVPGPRLLQHPPTHYIGFTNRIENHFETYRNKQQNLAKSLKCNARCSHSFTGAHLGSLALTWMHFDSHGNPCTHTPLDSPVFIRIHLYSLGLPWTHEFCLTHEFVLKFWLHVFVTFCSHVVNIFIGLAVSYSHLI